MMRILLLGGNGQLGWELQRSLSPLGRVLVPLRAELDLLDSEGLRALIRNFRPNFIVNAAAYTAVDLAEVEPDLSYALNATMVGILAQEAVQLGALLIHFSTDYVFNGEKYSPYVENDNASPISIYGRSKLAGEDLIRASGAKHIIMRTSWIYSIRGSNFPLTILQRAKQVSSLKIVSDGGGVPTSAHLIADVTALIIYRLSHDLVKAGKVSGTYHLVASGQTTWYEYAKFLIACAVSQGFHSLVSEHDIAAVSSNDYKTPAARPKNCLLDNSKVMAEFGIVLPDWRDHVTKFIDDLKTQGRI